MNGLSFFRIGFTLFWMMVFAGCNKEAYKPISSATLPSDYYPVTLGKYRIYNVKKIKFNFAGVPDTQYFQLKEIVSDTFIDLEKRKSYKIERTIRPTDFNFALSKDTSWRMDTVWSTRITPKEIVVFENNIPFVKLSFPLSADKQWDGNLYNLQGVDNYTLQCIDCSVNINTIKYNNAVVVIQNDDSTVLERKFCKEIYSRNVGLIYKEIREYEDECKYNFEGKPCVPGTRIANGTIFTQKIMRYGPAQ